MTMEPSTTQVNPHDGGEAPRLNEETFSSLVDSVKDYAIIMLDTQGRVRSWNAGAARLKGYAKAEIIGQSMERFYLPEDVAAGTPVHLLERAAADGSSEGEGWRVRKDGSRFFANVVLTAIRDASGEGGYAKITRDITERRKAEQQLQEQKEWAEILLEAAPDPVVIVEDCAGRIVTVNRRTDTTFDYPRAGASPTDRIAGFRNGSGRRMSRNARAISKARQRATWAADATCSHAAETAASSPRTSV